jgi:hypothetical protein
MHHIQRMSAAAFGECPMPAGANRTARTSAIFPFKLYLGSI